MRSRYLRMIPMTLIAILLALGSARASTFQIESKIIEVNAQGKYLKLYYLDPQTQKTDEIRVDVSDSTRFDGVQSLSDLNADDEISVQVDYNNFSHEWNAQYISVLLTKPV